MKFRTAAGCTAALILTAALGVQPALAANDVYKLSVPSGYENAFVDVQAERKKVVLPTVNNKKVMVVEDVSQANMYDVTVTLTDTAKITKDGAVVGGNKIKIGLPITLEGRDYKFTGTVSDLKIINETADAELNKTIQSINTADNV